MPDKVLPKKDLVRQISLRLLMLITLMLAFFFLPAGTWDFWQAWIYMLITLVPMSAVMLYLIKHNPKLIERRMNFKERRAEQKKIMYLSLPFHLLIFLLPGFDRRYGWSSVPVWAVIAADILVLLGYGIIFLVFKENSYASRVIEVSSEQRVISTGPYAVVRHPMYAGFLLMSSFTPLALGSWIALIPALPLIPFIVLRILDEEKMLMNDLLGYREYMGITPFRLIPGVW